MPLAPIGSHRAGRSAAELLRAAVPVGARASMASPTSGPLDPEVLSAVAVLAPFHRVTGFVIRALRDRDGTAEVVDGLRLRARVGAATQLRSVLDLPFIGAALADVAPSWVLVKGPALAETVYEEPADRTFSDLDVVVTRGEFATAIAALESAGAVVTDRNWTLLEMELRGQVHLVLPSGTPLDLHWHLLNRSRVRAAFSLDMVEMFDRRVSVPIGGVRVATLDATDTVLHVCLHSALSGGHRLYWYVDVDRAIRRRTPDWDALVTRARRWRARAAVGVVLFRARQVLATPVPQEVLLSLIGPGWRVALSTLERLEPLGSALGEHGASTLLLPTARDVGRPGLSPRLARLAQLASAPALSRAIRRSGAPASHDYLDEAEESGSRAAFLAAVALAP